MSAINYVEEFGKICIPPLTYDLHKGECGRIAIIGGSKEYTGAPYFAAMASLRTGNDLVHLFSEASAAAVLKSYSPELIVHPYLKDMEDLQRSSREGTNNASHRDADIESVSKEVTEKVTSWFSRFHTVVVGCGLSSDPLLMKTARNIILYARTHNIPLVVDADGLAVLAKEPELLQQESTREGAWMFLTPNLVELNRLHNAVISILPKTTTSMEHTEEKVRHIARSLGRHVMVIAKGPQDIISDGEQVVCCSQKGSPRRFGGQGDLLAGILATFVTWTTHRAIGSSSSVANPYFLAAYTASYLVRSCSQFSYIAHKRGLTTSHLIEAIPSVFEHIFSNPTITTSLNK
jgi:ATP-dependent NAD(P)H-hydrate dehydratase